MPKIPHASRNPLDTPEEQEVRWLKEIAAVPGHGGFPAIYKSDVQAGADLEARLRYLACVLGHIRQDTDKDGIPDWSAIVDGRAARILFPADEDIDGDGMDNVVDPDPYRVNIVGTPAVAEVRLAEEDGVAVQAAKRIPAHIRIDAGLRPEAARWQRILFDEFAILALDHTDKHSPEVLKEFVFLLREGMPKGMIQRTQSFRYLYAFSGHDAFRNLAAYHRTAQTISVGGEGAYGSVRMTGRQRIHLLATLAHEIGHAYVFDNISPFELKRVGIEYGHWEKVLGDTDAGSHYDRAFSEPHPFLKLSTPRHASQVNLQFTQQDRWRKSNLTSQYAGTNVHEWFADAIAAYVLLKMGRANKLGENWGESLTRLPRNKGEYWVNYNNLSDTFAGWLGKRLRSEAGYQVAEHP